MARFFQTINKHRKALDLAIEQEFGGALDPVGSKRAFESVEPRDATLPGLIDSTRKWLERHSVELR